MVINFRIRAFPPLLPIPYPTEIPKIEAVVDMKAYKKLRWGFAKETGIKTTVLRFFTVYGPGNRQDMAAFNFTRDILAQKPINLFGYNTKRDFTFVDDIIDGILGAIVRPFDYEVINLGSSRPVKVIELIREIEKTAGKKAKINRGGLPAGDVPVTFANIDKAKKLLGWQPHTSLKAGVEKLVEWYKLR